MRLRLIPPVYCAPVAGIKNNYGAEMSEEEYNKATVEGCLEAGTLAFTGDGIDIDNLFAKPLQAVLDHEGMGIPTIKPWCEEGVQARIDRFKGQKVLALATDVDAAGLVLLRKGTTPVVNKSVADLTKMKAMAGGINRSSGTGSAFRPPPAPGTAPCRPYCGRASAHTWHRRGYVSRPSCP